MPQADNHARLHLAPFHLRPEIGAARDQHGLRAFAREDLGRFSNGFRSSELEVR
jgi:hypothetical protein